MTGRDDEAPGSFVRRRLENADLRASWEAHAGEFVAWARAPGHDNYSRFHRDQFLDLLPEPGRATLDLGCGEGRLARDLRASGHRVTGVDRAPTMLLAARDADPTIPFVLADATALPFDDGSFDLAVAFMFLQDADDMPGAVREASRILEPGGRLCVAVVHPIGSAGVFGDDPERGPAVEGYLESFPYEDAVTRDGLSMTFVQIHRPITAYVDALADAGFLIERLRETPIPRATFDRERDLRRRRLPPYLHIRAWKPSPGASPARLGPT